jgi:hypothetical protein
MDWLVTWGQGPGTPDPEVRLCPKCKQYQPWDADTWGNNPDNLKGVQYVCPYCLKGNNNAGA